MNGITDEAPHGLLSSSLSTQLQLAPALGSRSPSSIHSLKLSSSEDLIHTKGGINDRDHKSKHKSCCMKHPSVKPIAIVPIIDSRSVEASSDSKGSRAQGLHIFRLSTWSS